MDEKRVADIISLFRYRNIPVTMLCLFKALYEGGTEFQTSLQLQMRIWGRDEVGFSRLGFGGLGYRIMQVVPEYRGILLLIDIQKVENEWGYRFLPEAMEAIERNLILKEVITNHAYGDLRARQPYPFTWASSL